MEFWRRCTRMFKMDKIRNGEVRKRAGVDNDVLNYIEEEIGLVWICQKNKQK